VDGAAVNPLVILGATGSIGKQTLEVAERLEIPVDAVAARRGSNELLGIAAAHPDARVGVAAPTEAEKQHFTAELGDRVRFGADALSELAGEADRTVVNGIVGAAGLAASVAALTAGNRLALANKESLVAGGPVLQAARDQGGGELLPVDSEHSALMQCLTGEDISAVRRLILTASGGPFRGRDAGSLADVTVAEALAHPTWAMGPRITIDSATLMNKAFEVIEAHYLFGLDYDRIDVVVHPQSIVHSLVEFIDGSLKAHLGEPDMRVPIQYALTYPHRGAGSLPPFPLAEHTLTFESPDRTAFPLLELGYEAGRRGESAPAVLNAADEIAVEAFLDGRIGFSAIPRVVAGALERVPLRKLESVADVVAVDAEARSVASELAGAC
jgi:1-deoxy-D-xylulose-5-phosphate reductoisomerase